MKYKFQKELRYGDFANQKRIYFTGQAISTLDFYGVDKEKLMFKLMDLLNECFQDIDFPAHRINICKTSLEDMPDCPHIQIEIRGFWRGDKK